MRHYVLVVKEDCETCRMIQPAIAALAANASVRILSQDNPDFPAGLVVEDDASLESSFKLKIDIVPTLISYEDEHVRQRLEGWQRAEWEHLTGLTFEPSMPGFRPGCGSKTQDPGMPEKLAVKYGMQGLKARRVDVADGEDEIEACSGLCAV
jgi:thiol-disulfide isomerase/thioredoxin